MAKKKKPDPYLVDDENPEWTDEMFKTARRGLDVLYEDFGKENVEKMLEGKIKIRPVAEKAKD